MCQKNYLFILIFISFVIVSSCRVDQIEKFEKLSDEHLEYTVFNFKTYNNNTWYSYLLESSYIGYIDKTNNINHIKISDKELLIKKIFIAGGYCWISTVFNGVYYFDLKDKIVKKLEASNYSLIKKNFTVLSINERFYLIHFNKHDTDYFVLDKKLLNIQKIDISNAFDMDDVKVNKLFFQNNSLKYFNSSDGFIKFINNKTYEVIKGILYHPNQIIYINSDLALMTFPKSNILNFYDMVNDTIIKEKIFNGVPSNENIKGISKLSNDEVVILFSNTGLCYYNLKNDNYKLFTKKDGLYGKYYISLYSDDDNIWIGYNDGFMKINMEWFLKKMRLNEK